MSRPNITHFVQGLAYRSPAWRKKHEELRESGWTLLPISGIVVKCEICSAEHVAVDLCYVDKPLADRTHDEQLFTSCLNCGWTVEQVAVFKGEFFDVVE